MTEFSIKTKISKKGYLVLAVVLAFQNNLIRITFILGLIMLISEALIFTGKIENPFTNSSPLLILGIFFISLPLIILFKTNSLYNKSKELSQEYTFHFNDSYIKVVDQKSISSFSWDKILKAKFFKKYLILFIGRGAGKIIERKYLTKEQEVFIMGKVNSH